MAASDRPIQDRLCGLETEYAIVLPHSDTAGPTRWDQPEFSQRPSSLRTDQIDQLEQSDGGQPETDSVLFDDATLGDGGTVAGATAEDTVCDGQLSLEEDTISDVTAASFGISKASLDQNEASDANGDLDQAAEPSRYGCYLDVVTNLGERIPLAPAKSYKEGVFLATGGAVWFETVNPATEFGLIEGSTPECRSPLELIAYQRAQDELLSAASPHPLLKNCRDAAGNIFGAQENYEVDLASGASLFFWRCGLLVAMPLAVLTWLLVGLVVLSVFALFIPFALLISVGQTLGLVSQRVHRACLGQFQTDERWVAPRFFSTAAMIADRATVGPMAAYVFLLAWLTCFRPHRRKLPAFLVTRMIFAGAGSVDDHGQLLMGQKARAMTNLFGYGGFFRERCMITIGHLLKSTRNLFHLFSLWDPRQRLQIAVGDSNMAESAEYLRTGTTLLVLDAIEFGYLPDVPQMPRPVRALQELGESLSLEATIAFRNGHPMNPIQVQRFYYDACYRMVKECYRQGRLTTEQYDDRKQVLTEWHEVLSQLEKGASQLVGRVDWVTKRFLLAELPEMSIAARQKLDLKYHLVGPDGYYEHLRTGGLATKLVPADQLERACRMPPPNSPATRRGHIIREFAGDAKVKASWKQVRVSQEKDTRVIRLGDNGLNSEAAD